jgi:hypothetical protein
MNVMCGIDHHSAPMGRHAIAQGKAQRRPGTRRPGRFQALKGRNAGIGHPPSGAAPSGRNIISIPQPMALPWAVAFGPVGAGGVTVPRSKAMPWGLRLAPSGFNQGEVTTMSDPPLPNSEFLLYQTVDGRMDRFPMATRRSKLAPGALKR